MIWPPCVRACRPSTGVETMMSLIEQCKLGRLISPRSSTVTFCVGGVIPWAIMNAVNLVSERRTRSRVSWMIFSSFSNIAASHRRHEAAHALHDVSCRAGHLRPRFLVLAQVLGVPASQLLLDLDADGLQIGVLGEVQGGDQ